MRSLSLRERARVRSGCAQNANHLPSCSALAPSSQSFPKGGHTAWGECCHFDSLARRNCPTGIRLRTTRSPKILPFHHNSRRRAATICETRGTTYGRAYVQRRGERPGQSSRGARASRPSATSEKRVRAEKLSERPHLAPRQATLSGGGPAAASKLLPPNVLTVYPARAAAFFCQRRLVRHDNCNRDHTRKAKWPQELPDPFQKPCSPKDTVAETC